MIGTSFGQKQVLFDFETGGISSGTLSFSEGTAVVVDNPFKTGINTSNGVYMGTAIANAGWNKRFAIFSLTSALTITTQTRYLHLLMYMPQKVGGQSVFFNATTLPGNDQKGITRYDFSLKGANGWYDAVIDLNYFITNNVQINSIGVLCDNMNWANPANPTAQDSYYIDNIQLTNSEVPADFQSGDLTFPDGMIRLIPQDVVLTSKNTLIISANDKRIVKTSDKIFFTASTSDAGEEIWVSDGTPTGTKMVKDINPGATGSNPSWLCAAGDRCFFAATTADAGTELWVTDGTEEGTKMVKDIYPGPTNNSSPKYIEALNSQKVLFYAQDELSHDLPLIDQNKPEQWVWVSDGTAAGTFCVAQTPARDSWDDSQRRFAVTDNGKAFFAGYSYETNETLFMTDGTVNGSGPVKDINPTPTPGSWADTAPAGLQWITPVGNKVIFRANTVASVTNDPTLGQNGEIGSEIWISDGTAAGTNWIGVDFAKGAANGAGVGSQFACTLVLGNGLVLFRANDGVHNVEPCIIDINKPFVDGENPRMIMDVNPWSPPNQPSWPENWTCIFNGHVYFHANGTYWLDDQKKADGTLKDLYSGNSVWRIDVSSMDVASINKAEFMETWTNPRTRIGPYNFGSGGWWYTEVDGKLYFAASDESGPGLWYMDATGQPQKYFAFNGTAADYHLMNLKGALVFAGGSYFQHSLYRVGNINTAIKDTRANNDNVEIYPNPSREVINFKSSSKVSNAVVLDALGHTVFQSDIKDNSLNISKLSVGLYFIKVTTEDGLKSTQKLMVR